MGGASVAAPGPGGFQRLAVTGDARIYGTRRSMEAGPGAVLPVSLSGPEGLQVRAQPEGSLPTPERVSLEWQAHQ